MTTGAIVPDRLMGHLDQVVGALKVLANPDRLALLCKLSQHEMCVGEMEGQLGIRQPTLSQQLGVLRAEGVVTTRREGKHVFYSVADRRLVQILATLARTYCPKE
jgi:DNA-binding transcriptional ArsR family regulator